MVLRKEIPKVHVFSTPTGDVILRPDLNCYLVLPSLPTSPCAELRPLHPSLQDGEHYFGSRWHNTVYVIKDNNLLGAKDLTSGPSGEVRRLHPSCYGGQHYFIVGGDSFGIILSPGTVAAVRDLTTGEPVPYTDPVPHADPCQWSTEKMESIRSYLYWHLRDNFSGEFFSFHPTILSFLPGGLGLTQGPAFGAWKLLNTFHNYSNTSATKIQGVSWKVGCMKEKLAEIGHGWTASQPGSPEPRAIAVALTKAQFALPTQYGGLGLNTEGEDWGEVRQQEETFQFTLEPEGAVYVWQYHLGLGRETILLCKEIKITYHRDPPSEISLPAAS